MQASSKKPMKDEIKKEQEKGRKMSREERIRYTGEWGRGIKVERKRLTTPRNYEAS